MNNKLTCNIVQDLLPNYIENLTREETNNAIAEHLHTCEDCKEAYDQMNVDIDVETVPTIELKFLKKVKRTRILAAVVTIILTLFLSYFLYASEYQYTRDKNSLSMAITEFTSPFDYGIDAYVLETKEMDGVLIATFKDRTRPNVNGVAILNKGLNQRYRIISAKIDSSKYSSVVQIHFTSIKNEPYYIVNGYNLADEIKYYGLDYDAYTHPGHLADDRVTESIKFQVVNQQFMDIYSLEEIENIFESSVDIAYHDSRLSETSLYDENGNDVTEEFLIENNLDGPKGSIGKAELFLLNVYIGIILVIGFTITRYYLTD